VTFRDRFVGGNCIRSDSNILFALVNLINKPIKLSVIKNAIGLSILSSGPPTLTGVRHAWPRERILI